ncbi:UNVERIFIED_CONTAM: hypothetical protein BEN50_13680 [Euhalothece sp. KZN 001]
MSEGSIRLQVINDLFVREYESFSQLDKKSYRDAVSLFKLAGKISQNQGISPDQAIQEMEMAFSDKSKIANFGADIADELEKLIDADFDEHDKRIQQVTIFLLSRGEFWDETNEKWVKISEWEGDWGEEITKELPESWLDEIMEVIKKEQNKGEAPKKQEKTVTEVDTKSLPSQPNTPKSN